MRVNITYDYGDMVVEWNGWTGVILVFSQDGERLGALPRAYTQEDVEDILRDELGYVPENKIIRAATLNVFPFP
jgi:hypothetical protein